MKEKKAIATSQLGFTRDNPVAFSAEMSAFVKEGRELFTLSFCHKVHYPYRQTTDTWMGWIAKNVNIVWTTDLKG